VSRFAERAQAVCTEIGAALARVDPAQVDALVVELLAAGEVVLAGVGREGLAGRALAMRLVHAGLRAHWVWDDTTPAVGPGDLVLVVSGSGAIGHLDHVAQRALAAGARLAVVTAEPTGRTATRADVVLWLPAAAYGASGDVVPSVQPMGSLFEQVALVTFDLLVSDLAERQGLGPDALASRHRNVE
jgi:6-phospho-3-hexuloisomerase